MINKDTENSAMQEIYNIFKEMGYVDEKNRLTVDFFILLSKPYASNLVHDLIFEYCGDGGIEVICDTITVLLDNGFIDSAYCVLEYVYKQATGSVPNVIEKMCEDEDYAPMFLRSMANSLLEFYRSIDWDCEDECEDEDD